MNPDGSLKRADLALMHSHLFIAFLRTSVCWRMISAYNVNESQADDAFKRIASEYYDILFWWCASLESRWAAAAVAHIYPTKMKNGTSFSNNNNGLIARRTSFVVGQSVHQSIERLCIHRRRPKRSHSKRIAGCWIILFCIYIKCEWNGSGKKCEMFHFYDKFRTFSFHLLRKHVHTESGYWKRGRRI